MAHTTKKVAANVFETLKEGVVKPVAGEIGQAAKDIGKGLTTDFLKDLYGVNYDMPAHSSHEQVSESNATPLNPEILKMKAETKEQDDAQIAQLRRQFFSRVGEEGASTRARMQSEGQTHIQQEQQEAQLRQQARARATNQPALEPMGKQKKSIFGGKKQKTGGMRIQPQNFEQKSNKGK